MIPRTARVVVVGATGAVGREALVILASRGHSPERVVAAASARSAGARVAYGAQSLRVERLEERLFDRGDIVLLCATSQVAREWAPRAVERGGVVIDNSSAFRADPDVPLVVPECNGELLDTPGVRLVANPNCSTIMMLVALEPLRARFGVASIVVSTYQAVSGAGAAAMEELTRLSRAALEGREELPSVFQEPCAFNVFSHNAAVHPETGLNGEEAKMISESRRIWGSPALRISPTCVRVPVMRAHAQAITVRLASAARLGEVRSAYAGAAGVRLVDDRAANSFPTPLKAAGGDHVLVGRLRADPGEPADEEGRTQGFALLLAADQLRKGAALNAVQIADRLCALLRR